MRILVMRHGVININITLRDKGLNEEGKKQVKGAAKNLHNESISAIYSSPALRAQETAEIVGEALGAQITILESLKDVGISGVNYTEHWYSGWSKMQWQEVWVHGSPGFEHPNYFLGRIRIALEKIANQHKNNETVLIVGHEETIWALMTLINNVPLEEAIKTKIKHALIIEFHLEAC